MIYALWGPQNRIQISAITPTSRTTSAGLDAKLLKYKVPASGTAPGLYQVARRLHVKVTSVIGYTNMHADRPAWWYYEARHHYHFPLPRGTVLYYAKQP